MTTKQQAAPRSPTAPDGAAKLRRQYGCGPAEFTGTDRSSTSGISSSTMPSSSEAAGPREQFEAVARSVRDVLSQRWLLHRGHPRPGEPKAGLLPVDGVSDRPLAGQQHHQPPARAPRPSKPSSRRTSTGSGCSNRSRTPAWATAAWAGSRPASSTRWPPCRSRPWGTACATNTASSGRRSRTASRSSTRTTGWPSPIPGKWPGRGKRSRCPLGCSFHLENGVLRAVPGHPTHLLGVPYDRPVVGYGGRTINTLRLWEAASPDFFDFGEFSSGDFVGAIVDRVARRNRHARPLSGRFHRRGSGTALRPGVFPGLLLAGRHRGPLPAHERRLATPPRQGRHPAQRHASGDGRGRVDAHPPRSGQPRLGRGVGPDRPHAGLHQPHPAARGAGKVAGSLLRAGLPTAAGDHLRDQPPLPRRRAAALPGRRGPRAADEPHRGDAGPPGAHGQPRHRRHAQHQRRGPDPLRPAADPRGRRLRGPVPRAIQQQDQRRDAATLAAAGKPRPGRADHRGDRRRLGDRPRRVAPTAAAGRRRRLFATASARRSRPPRSASRPGSRPPRARWSIRTPSSTARSSASTSTSGSCSTCCTSSCSTTGCGPIPT